MDKPINAFPGYEFQFWESDKHYHNMYRDTDVGKGGYVFAEPGIYENVALLDVASMHPHSLIALNCFGKYTERFKELMDARIAIKHGDFDTARKMLDGKLAPYLSDETTAKDLAQALKLSINSVFGLTYAKFDNPMRDKRNKENIVALRGALTMRTLQDEVQDQGFSICHIKTDSCKIPNATPEIIQFVMDFGKRYGYTFEHEATYEKMCLVNDAVYIAKYSDDETINGKNAGKWTATGTQFQVPYVFKTLFSKEPIVFEDMCETKSVKTAIYLYFDEQKKSEDDYDAYRFVGKVGQFCPIKPCCGGATLFRQTVGEDGETTGYSAVTGTKGYHWLESEMVKELGKEDDIDKSYYTRLVDEAVEAISQYGDFEQFVSD